MRARTTAATSEGGAMASFLGWTLVVFPPLFVFHDQSRLYLLYLLALTGFIAIARRGWDMSDKIARLLLVVVVTAVVTGTVALLGADSPAAGWREFDAFYSTLLFILPIFFLFQRWRPPVALLWWGAMLGGAAAGVVALVELHRAFPEESLLTAALHPGRFRVSGGSIATIFGMMVGNITLFALASITYVRHRPPLWPLWAASASLGLFACVASGTRGAWAGMVAALLLAYVLNWRRLSLQFRIAVIALAALGAVALAALPSVQARLGSAMSDVETLQENSRSSLGLRLEAWRAALWIAADHPLLGIGFDEQSYRDALSELKVANVIKPRTASLPHSHNQFLHALVTSGVLGASALLALMLAFPYLFFRAWRTAEAALRPVALAGLMISVATLVYGLVDVPLLRRAPQVSFVLLMGILLGFCFPAGKARTASADSAASDSLGMVPGEASR